MRVRVRQGFDSWKDPVWVVEYRKWYFMGWLKFRNLYNKEDAIKCAKNLKYPEIFEVYNETL